MIEKEEMFREETVLTIAKKMCLAARTAPKGKGMDLLEILIIRGEEVKRLSFKMKEIGEREDNKTFLRDSENILNSQAIVIIGTRKKTLGLKYCGLCGFPNCSEAQKADTICVFNPGDLGIALGSAAAVAADNRIDNRIMYTVGIAASELKLLGEGVIIAYGIPLSVSGKNPFFDRG